MKFLFLLALIFVNSAVFSLAQTEQMGGSSTGEAKTYSSKRTTGIVDERAPRVFEDVTANTALKNFR